MDEKGPSWWLERSKEVRLRFLRHTNHSYFFVLGVLRRFGLIETPYWGLMVLYILRQNVHNRPAGANGRPYQGQCTGLVAAALFFHKTNSGFRCAFQFCAFFWPP